MILSKTPFRISFAGGGSDLPDFYRRRAGAVVSTTIDKAMYLAIHPYFHDKIRIKYSRTEDVMKVSDISIRWCGNVCASSASAAGWRLPASPTCPREQGWARAAHLR